MFKTLDEVTRPDPRNASSMMLDDRGGLRAMTLADHHAAIAELNVSADAPSDVRALFTRARHAFLYAWFDYELTPLAEQQALAALEAALRHKVGGSLGARATLVPLAEKAVKLGLIPSHLGTVRMSAALGAVRNLWAHGSSDFASPGASLTMIGLCAELINGMAWSD